MAKKVTKRNIGEEILNGIRDIKDGNIGRTTIFPAVSDIRDRVGLSQSEFARLLGVSVRTLQEWEQGRRAPSGPARTLLTIAYQNPQALLDVAV
jgi:putative transcriptional regulator